MSFLSEENQNFYCNHPLIMKIDKGLLGRTEVAKGLKYKQHNLKQIQCSSSLHLTDLSVFFVCFFAPEMK